MKKKLMLILMSSLFALGMVTACGDIENDPGQQPNINDGGIGG
ncbi:hypothetical protein QA612_07225 [Evansella sp. AB-P1]|nr:hypothetical protein [Evansella sp. AB-P1]MDG5787281.1 hypothetical protein [Evansella sp. AB-P1]